MDALSYIKVIYINYLQLLLLLNIFLNIHAANSVLASSILTIRELYWFCSPESVSQDVLLCAKLRGGASQKFQTISVGL